MARPCTPKTEIAGGTRNGIQLGSAFRINEKLTLDIALKRVDENGLPVSPAASIPGNPSSAIGTPTSPLTPSGGFFGTGNNALNPATGTAILAPQTAAANSGAGTPLEATTVQLGAQYQATEQLLLAGELEHSIDGDEQKRLALGAGYQLSERSRLYGRVETQTRSVVGLLTGPGGQVDLVRVWRRYDVWHRDAVLLGVPDARRSR